MEGIIISIAYKIQGLLMDILDNISLDNGDISRIFILILIVCTIPLIKDLIKYWKGL